MFCSLQKGCGIPKMLEDSERVRKSRKNPKTIFGAFRYFWMLSEFRQMLWDSENARKCQKIPKKSVKAEIFRKLFLGHFVIFVCFRDAGSVMGFRKCAKMLEDSENARKSRNIPKTYFRVFCCFRMLSECWKCYGFPKMREKAEITKTNLT